MIFLRHCPHGVQYRFFNASLAVHPISDSTNLGNQAKLPLPEIPTMGSQFNWVGSGWVIPKTAMMGQPSTPEASTPEASVVIPVVTFLTPLAEQFSDLKDR